MMNLDYLDNSSNESNFIKAIDVEYKAKEGSFSYFNGTERVQLSDFEGIIVGSGFQFRGTLGSVSKKKGTSYLSEDFVLNKDNQRLIHCHKFVRDGDKRSNESMGDKTYAAWKEEGLRPCRVVFVVKPEDTATIYKLCFPPVASVSIAKELRADAPNFISTFFIKDEMFETDNGEFLVPGIRQGDAIPASIEADVNALVKKVYDTLAKKTPIAMATPAVAEEVF